MEFLQRSQLLEDAYTRVLQNGLLRGKAFSALLADLGFSDAVVTQISLSEVHGNTQLSLEKIQDYLENLSKVRKKMIEVATYPLILLSFLVLIMVGLKNYLLPQLEEGNLATVFIQHFPSLFLSGTCILLLLAALSYFWYSRTKKLRMARTLSSLPFVGGLLRRYLTAYYAREWGNLIGQGLEMSQIVTLMQEQDSQLFQEIGYDLEQALLAGIDFHERIKTYPFFQKELSLMIEYGQAKSKLGYELALYADECWEQFFSKLNQSMQWIQPLIFLFVAVMIVLLYAAMLLPIYQNMEI